MKIRNGKYSNYCSQPPKARGYRRQENAWRGGKFAKTLRYASCESYELRNPRRFDSFLQNYSLKIKKMLCVDIKKDRNNLECVQKRTTKRVKELRTHRNRYDVNWRFLLL